MTEHHDEHGQDGHGGHHSAPSIGGWLDQHLGGAIMPFGERLEAFFDKSMFLIVNGFFLRAAKVCVVIMTPVLLVEFVIHTVRF